MSHAKSLEEGTRQFTPVHVLPPSSVEKCSSAASSSSSRHRGLALRRRDAILVGGGGHGAGPPQSGGLPPARLPPAGSARESPPVINRLRAPVTASYLLFVDSVTLVLVSSGSSDASKSFGAIIWGYAGVICWTSRRCSRRQRAP
jgi:hypothetical protein